MIISNPLRSARFIDAMRDLLGSHPKSAWWLTESNRNARKCIVCDKMTVMRVNQKCCSKKCYTQYHKIEMRRKYHEAKNGK